MEFLNEYHLAGLFIGICTFFDYRPFSPCRGKGRILLGHQMLVDIPDTRHCRCRSIAEHRQCHSVFSVRRICLLFVLDHQRGLEQEDRVKKGWFPKNPKRKYKF